MHSNPDVEAHGPFEIPLKHLSARLKGTGPVKIVAVGSSSVAGEWETDILPFPPRLEMSLRWKFPDARIDVINRGRRGENAPDQEKRLQRDVVEQGPDMVIWQVGTNAVWKNKNLGKELDAIVCGLDLLRLQPLDIVLMDLQYVEPIIAKEKIEKARWMVQAIGDVAKKAGVNVFRRFEVMRRWHEVEKIPLKCMVNPRDDAKLHHNDKATLRISYALRDLIVQAVAR